MKLITNAYRWILSRFDGLNMPNKDSTMKAQVTLEYLLVSVVAIGLLSISMYALIKIKENADKSEKILRFKATANELFSSIDELCALGNGNSMQVKLQAPVKINSNSKKNADLINSNSENDEDNDLFYVIVESTNTEQNADYNAENNNISSIAHNTKCEINVDGNFDKEIVIENKDGIIISPNE